MKNKLTTNLLPAEIDVLIDKYINKKLTLDEWSRLTPALRKKILRAAKKRS